VNSDVPVMTLELYRLIISTTLVCMFCTRAHAVFPQVQPAMSTIFSSRDWLISTRISFISKWHAV